MAMAEPGHVAEQMAEPSDVARAPLKMVGGKLWSPGVYSPVKVAWKQSFVRTLIFN
jgi:hypothetical protein